MTILGMDIAPWILLCILVYSVFVTLITDWLVTGFQHPELPRRVTLRGVATTMANLIWIALVCVFGVLAVRYIERISSIVFGYLAFAMIGFVLSWLRAYLYRRVQDRRKPERSTDWQALAGLIVHNLSYLLFALVTHLAFSWLLRLPVDPVLFIPLFVSSLLPDLDSRDSLPGRLLPWLSQKLEDRLGYLEEWHTLAATAFVALISAPLILLFGIQTWYLIPFGFLSHLVLDMLTPPGVMLFWPLNRTRYRVFKESSQPPGGHAERITAVGLAIAASILLLVVDLGPPEPVPAPAPSYQQTLDRYYSMRGRTQVFAYIEGSWQVSGRPISGRFEILNASDESFIILDRYSGRIFTGGRTADDNVYLNRIVLQSGPTVFVKPVEVHLDNQPLADTLSTVYAMQNEPGLQHIYVSGDLLLPVPQDAASPRLQVDYSQTSLRRIRMEEAGHYVLSYLTAADLIELAALRVDTADLVIFATYTREVAGPTVTPLPTPAPETKPAQ